MEKPIRSDFDSAYDEHIIGGAFLETNEYYSLERERYWRTLCFLFKEGLQSKRRVVEFGGGQMAILLNKLYGTNATVVDISNDYRQPIDHAKIPFLVGNLLDPSPLPQCSDRFDLIILLEVIEHIYVPPHMVFKNLQRILTDSGSIFLTTPNLFRLRNILRMIRGKDPFDRFMVPVAGVGPGHQIEYSSNQIRWQLEYSGFSVRPIHRDQLGQIGHSGIARIGRKLLSPLLLNPTWREELVVTADVVP